MCSDQVLHILNTSTIITGRVEDIVEDTEPEAIEDMKIVHTLIIIHNSTVQVKILKIILIGWITFELSN